MDGSEGLTAGGEVIPPVLLGFAGSGVGVQEGTVELIHIRIYTQQLVCTALDVGCCVDSTAKSSRQRCQFGTTAVREKDLQNEWTTSGGAVGRTLKKLCALLLN